MAGAELITSSWQGGFARLSQNPWLGSTCHFGRTSAVALGGAYPALLRKHLPGCFGVSLRLLLLKYVTRFYEDAYGHTQASAFGKWLREPATTFNEMHV